jgi:secondary thiamine-phosphate synthase enzyme
MIEQVRFELKRSVRGCHLVTREILEHLPQPLPKAGLLNLFVQHTSCALSINENADSDVRTDMAKILDRLVKENEPYYDHTLEGADDMPAHAKCSMLGVSLTIPITDGRLNLGTWQGIYLCEFRDYGGPRKIIATIYS